MNQKTKDIVMCALYFILMLYFLVCGHFVIDTIVALWCNLLDAEFPSFVSTPMLILVFNIASLILFLIFILNLMMPFGLTFVALAKDWSKYITTFFDSLLYMTLALIITFVFWNMTADFDGFLYIESYLVLQVFALYVIFFIRYIYIKIMQFFRKN